MSDRPTIVHVRMYPFGDRVAPFIRQTVLGLRSHARAVVLAPSFDGGNPPDVRGEQVSRADLRDPVARRSLAAYLRAKYPNIALVIGHLGNGTLHAAPLARMLDVPLLGTFGGSDVNIEFHHPRYRDRYRALTRIPSARFLAVAGYLRDRLVAAGMPAERTFAWHRGVDLSAIAPSTRASTGAIRLLVCARFYEVKGHAYAIRAVAALRAQGRDVELVLLGDGPLEPDLRRLATELGVADRVRFVGHVPHGAVLDHLRRADIYVHPSVACAEGRTEGIPNAIMEAHASGLPVVATAHGGIPEVVVDGETGFLVPERDAAALAARIAALIDDPARRAAMGARGRRHVEQAFDLATQSRRLAAHAIETIAAGRALGHRDWSREPPHARGLPGALEVHARRAVWAVAATPQVRVVGRVLSRALGRSPT